MVGTRRAFRGLGSFSSFLSALAARNIAGQRLATYALTKTVFDKARGIYGDSSKLASLAPSTQDERVKKGYTANDPLLRTGEKLRDRLQLRVQGNIGGVGHPDEVAAYHEFGYAARDGSLVPARPVLHEAVAESEPEFFEIIEKTAAFMLGGDDEVIVSLPEG